MHAGPGRWERVAGKGRPAASIATLLAAVVLMAQSQFATDVPRPRPLGPIVARSSHTFGSVARVVTVAGSLFVNDTADRRLLILDPSLAGASDVLSSSSATGYGTFAAPEGLLQFRGDSILFQPRTAAGPALEGFIIDTRGKIARVAKIPQRDFVGCTVGDMDNTGWQRCEIPAELTWESPIPTGDSSISVGRSDSAVVMVVSFANWDVDTIARVQAPTHGQIRVDRRGAGASTTTDVWPLIANGDAWTLFRDGTLAIARASDYHIEIVTPQRAVTHGSRAPYEWRRLTDQDRARLLDSARRADVVAGRVRQYLADDDWPTHWPPFSDILVDADQRLWVHERQPVGADSISVYGIFDRNGEFLERVKVPAAHTVAGFGSGVVYLTSVESGRVVISAARFR